ncbi:MAG: hypothetical protein RXQ57_05290 [Caldivirga sp.]
MWASVKASLTLTALSSIPDTEAMCSGSADIKPTLYMKSPVCCLESLNTVMPAPPSLSMDSLALTYSPCGSRIRTVAPSLSNSSIINTLSQVLPLPVAPIIAICLLMALSFRHTLTSCRLDR